MSDIFENFHLLNEVASQERESEREVDLGDFDITSLQKKVNDAVEREDFETAQVYQNKIDRLIKKEST